MMQNRTFEIGDFCFQLEYPQELVIPSNFSKFEVDERKAEYIYHLQVADTFPQMEGKKLAERMDISVWQMPAGERRYIGTKGIDGYYACYAEADACSADVYLDSGRLEGMDIDPKFVSLLALERKMIARGNLILHCAYMQRGDKAVLFSAPSETGKTTQAGLWEKYRGTRTVNGDRALLRVIDGQWVADGWPVCGTSEVCNKEILPIEAIVMLSQGKTNEIRRLSHAEAFKLLYTQITVNTWNRESVVKTMERIDDLIAHVPVWQLSCTISEEAVECLETALDEN